MALMQLIFTLGIMNCYYLHLHPILSLFLPVTFTRQHSLFFRQNHMIIVGLILFIGLILGSAYIQFSSERQASTETKNLGISLAKQSELLIRPLLLANDRVSLNYLLNELNQLAYINGLQVQNQSGVIIARAGSHSDQKITQRILQQDKTIAIVTLWLDTTPLKQVLRSQLWPIGIIALATICMAIFTLWLFSRREESTLEKTDTNDERLTDLSFSETLAIQQEASFAENNDVEHPSEPEPIAFQENQSPPHAESAYKTAQTDVKKEFFGPNTNPKNEDLNDSSDKSTSPNNLQTASLVDLLKPEHENTPQMPKFEHHPQDLEPATSINTEEPFAVEEEVPTPATETFQKTKNPLMEIAEREEVQLGLYSFEDELELILAPQDAIYLFYIDNNTASSANMHADEKATLLNVYLHLAKQVARIYNGEVEQLDNQDILLRFELRDDKDSHGTNALCAAILFNLLYKGFNQSRIKGFQPVLSLQMSLSRGHHNKYILVKEEAHFLTRTTASNELISHTALTEAPLLKQSLLENADIRREDEDKVLLLKITPKHQAMLQKQANHLLTKIFKK